MPPGRFGTDGVRGVANAELGAELALALGRAAARVLPGASYLIGRDTRRSGPLLQSALAAGVAAEGVDVVDVGVIPTPGLAAVAAQRGLPAAMVSASHNPFSDNGIKLFAPGGAKLDVATESAVEAEMDVLLADPGHPPARPTGRGVGWVGADPTAGDHYLDHLGEAAGGRRLAPLHVVLDCANGAASGFAPPAFQALGATVTTIHGRPDGSNINDGCGSTHPADLVRAVVDVGADLGLAFDGDADRLVAVDHTGAVADGDVMLALFAVDLAERGELTGDTVVVTVMSNLGFRQAMAARGITVLETPVGDRHILEALDAGGLALGGEQSGHIVLPRHGTTGDGILNGILLADLLVRAGRPLAALAGGLVTRVPQVLQNVTVARPDGLGGAAEVWQAVADVEAELGDSGRVLLRASGTEPLVRVMVEAVSEERAADAAARLCAAVETALGPAVL